MSPATPFVPQGVPPCPHGIGSDSFRGWMEGLRAELLGQKKRKEDVAFRKTAATLQPAEVLSAAAEEFQVSEENLRLRMRGSMLRPLTAHLLRKHARLTQRQVAETLGLCTGAAVSIQLKSLRQALSGDRRLRETLAQVEQRLQAITPPAKGR